VEWGTGPLAALAQLRLIRQVRGGGVGDRGVGSNAASGDLITPPRKQDPRRQQDWILKGLQGGRAHPLAACGGSDALLSVPDLGEHVRRRGLMT
jgi:hypothetical protein